MLQYPMDFFLVEQYLNVVNGFSWILFLIALNSSGAQ